MSTDDDLPPWFSGDGSSDSAQEEQTPGAAPRLEAVQAGNSCESSWFDGSTSPADQDDEVPHEVARGAAWGAKALFASAIVVVLGVLAGGVFFLASEIGGGQSEEPRLLAVPTPQMSASSSSVPATHSVTEAASGGGEGCQPAESATVTTGNGSGDVKSVTGVVLAYQYRYYVDRDARKIGEILSRDSQITDLGALQAGIDSVAKGTSHCVRIVSGGEGTATAEVTEFVPGKPVSVHKQRVVTTRESGEVRIVTIDELP